MLCFPLCLLYFRAPFRQQTDSAVEKNTEGISASTPLGVITNRAILGSANGIASAGAAATPGKDLSAEEARERRRSVSRAAARVLGEQLSRGAIFSLSFQRLSHCCQSLRPLCAEGQTDSSHLQLVL